MKNNLKLKFAYKESGLEVSKHSYDLAIIKSGTDLGI